MTSRQPRTLLRRRYEEAHEQGPIRIRQTIADNTEFMPFLLLDDFSLPKGQPGFGAHPHRGQETITYLLQGGVTHQDSNGGKGQLRSGDMQIMKAGRGIVHDEQPSYIPSDPERGWGIQLWVALPETHLNDEPSYQDVIAKTIPSVQPAPGVDIKVILGDSFGASMPVRNSVPVWYFDVNLEPGAEIVHPMPVGFNVFCHILVGTPSIANEQGRAHETFFFKRDGDSVHLANKSEKPARLILVGGDPIDGQEVHRYGPFVSTSAAGINKAFDDYRKGINGFERAHSWSPSPISA